jgi:HPt (histidine-containing phosphotransfer) domain-containing protein
MHDAFDPTMIELLVNDIGENAAREVLQLFFRDSAEKLDMLSKAGDGCTSKIAQRHAHSLKSAAATFGFKNLSALAQTLEAEAHGLSLAEIALRARGLSAALAQAQNFSRLQ